MMHYMMSSREYQIMQTASNIYDQKLATGVAPGMGAWANCGQEALFLYEDMEDKAQQDQEKKIDLRASSATVEIDLTQELKGETLDFICTNCGEQGTDKFHYVIHTNGRCEDPNVSCYACKRVMCRGCRLNDFDDGGTLMLFPPYSKHEVETSDGDWEIHMCRWCVNKGANRLKRKKERKRLIKKDGKVSARIDLLKQEKKKIKLEKEL